MKILTLAEFYTSSYYFLQGHTYWKIKLHNLSFKLKPTIVIETVYYNFEKASILNIYLKDNNILYKKMHSRWFIEASDTDIIFLKLLLEE